MFRIEEDWELETRPRCFVLEDYTGQTPRWCPGCGDHAVLTALQRVCRDEQLPPEKTVVVSGIGCSSRLPHYVNTYGFHGLHGRALPVACGIRARRPDLHIFVVTGDGDCCAIGTGHWIHAIRYNMKMVVLMLDNHIYGLTKKQTSPTTPKGHPSFTHPRGSPISPLNPLTVTLATSNVSFVAQTVDWNAPHLYATLSAAHRHPGLAFVRILQRCPHYMPDEYEPIRTDPRRVALLAHPDGIVLEDAVARLFPNKVEHDPADHRQAMAIAAHEPPTPIGLLYRNPDAERYDLETARGIDLPLAEKLGAIQAAIDRHRI